GDPRRTRLADAFFPTRCPPPPSSTLFPYTTLFRSRRPGRTFPVLRPPGQRGDTLPVRGLRRGPPATPRLAGDDWAPPTLPLRELDRKSTRLNSSHLVISYAVFCLKKKTKRTRRSPS